MNMKYLASNIYQVETLLFLALEIIQSNFGTLQAAIVSRQFKDILNG